MRSTTIMHELPSPDFPYYITYVFPYDLYHEKIFQSNLSHILSDLKDWVEQKNKLIANENVLKNLKFDSQKRSN